jgi:hypothetical protein
MPIQRNTKPITWLASYPKSGNTWVRAILSSGLTGSCDINRLGYVVPSFNNAVKKVQFAANQLEPNHNSANFWGMAQRRAAFDISSKQIIFKTHIAALKYEGEKFPLENVTKKIIYVARDPRDVAISYANHYNLGLNQAIENIMSQNNAVTDPENKDFEFISSWEQHVTSWLALKQPKLIIKYEELEDDAIAVIRRIFDFVEIKPLIEYEQIAEQTSFKRLKKQEKKSGFVESVNKKNFFNKGRSKQWKNISETNWKKLAEQTSEAMSLLGYQMDCD